MHHSSCPTGLAALTLTAALLATPASGQTAACVPHAQMIAVLTGQLGEQRRANGLAGPEAVMELYSSDETGSWSITVTLTDGRSCLIARGSDFAAAAMLRPTPPGEGA